MAVLASNITSMIVEKRDFSSFRDVEIAVPQVYRACMGWGGGDARQTTQIRYRSHSLLPGWILQMGMGDVGVRFPVGLEPQNQNKTEVHIFQTLHASLCKTKRVRSQIFRCSLWPIDFALLPDIY